MATRASIRAELKQIGYKGAFQTNPLTDKLTTLKITQVATGIDLGGNVFTRDFLDAHKEAFAIKNAHTGTILDDTGQKVC